MYRYALALLAGSLASSVCAAQPQNLQLTPVYDGLTSPLFLTHAGDGSGRVFIVQQQGRILIGRNGVLEPEPFIDINASGMLDLSGEETGLLGLAFAPDFAESGAFYVNYTSRFGLSEIARYRVSADNPDRADPESRQLVLSFAQPQVNHNGGWMGFGPDGYLYIASGDGGGAGDPDNHAQRLNTLLGKMLRIDVSVHPYAIPDDNPFRNTASAEPEIWAYGLRNPWRSSFDRQTGDLWIADVGQARSEEVNFQPGGAAGGQNYGWRLLEGSQCVVANCNQSGSVPPVTEYGRILGCSVTGGYVYRGSRYPAMQGLYFFGDFCSGRIFSLLRSGEGATAASFTRNEVLASGGPISSFGEDEEGNLYVVLLSGSVLLMSDGPAQTGPVIDRRYTGTWFDPEQSGHGLFVEVLPEDLVLAYWFTFDPQGNQAWFGGVGEVSGNRVEMVLERARGGRFIPDFDASQIQYPPFGTLTLEFASCRDGRVDFALPDGFGSGSMPLARLTEPLGAECDRP